MKMYIKNSSKILYDYSMSLIVFVIFLYPFIGLTKDKLYTWLPWYSAVFFLFAFYLIYSDMKGLAVKEKRPQYQLNPYPLKGLVYGLISIVPVALLTLVGLLLHFENAAADRIREVIVNTILGPLYFLYGPLRESAVAYAASILLLPLTAMFGYLAGYFGIHIMKKVFRKNQVIQERTFTKSPWNPSNEAKKSSGKKKKKTKAPGGQ